MFSTARSRRHLKQAQEKWARKSSELEKQHASEVDDLEGRLQSASADVQKLTKQKRQLESTTQQSDTDVDRARSDAIELNSKQVELQERLNRKIREQERQIAELRGNALSATHTQSAATQPQREHPPVVEEEAYVDQLSTRIGHQRAYQNPGVTDTAPTTTEDDWHGGRHGGHLMHKSMRASWTTHWMISTMPRLHLMRSHWLVPETTASNVRHSRQALISATQA